MAPERFPHKRHLVSGLRFLYKINIPNIASHIVHLLQPSTMKTGYWILALLWSTSLWAQQPLRTDWIQTIPGNQFEENNSLALAPCGDLYTVGFFQNRFGPFTSYGSNFEDGFIIKYTNDGSMIWAKQLRGSSTDRVNGIHVTNDEEVYIVGEFRDTLFCGPDTLLSKGRLDIFVAKLDSSGNFLWGRSAGNNEDDSAHDIDVLPSGDLVLTGYHEKSMTWGAATTTAVFSRDVFLAAITPQGNPLWATTLSGPSADECNSVATDDYGNIYLSGSFRDFLFVNGNQVRAEGGVDAFLARYNSQGTLIWAKALGSLGADQGRYVQVDSDQNLVTVGWVSGYLAIGFDVYTGSQEEDAFAVKMDSNGTVEWAKIMAYTFDERMYGVDFDQHDNIYLMGTLDSISVIGGDTLRNRHLNRPTDIFIAKYSKDGTYRWAQTLGHYYNDFCYDLIVPNSRTVHIVGSYQDTTIFINDTLISAFDYDIFVGTFTMDTTLSVRRLVTTPALFPAQLLPNPSQAQTLLSYQLSATREVTLSLYNPTGQCVWQKALGRQPAGDHQWPIERRQLPTGLYYLHLEAEDLHRVLPLVWQ